MLALRLPIRAAADSDYSPPASTGTSISNFASLVFPTADSGTTQPTSPKSDVAKAVIEWLFVVIAVLLIACLILRRMLGTRPSPSPSRTHGHVEQIILADPSCFLGYPANMATVYLPYPVPARTHTPSIRRFNDVVRMPMPMRTQTRAADIDAFGRRATTNDDADLELGLGDKDVDALPAYDGKGRPPRYTAGSALAASGAVEPTVAEGAVQGVVEVGGEGHRPAAIEPTTAGEGAQEDMSR
ncbi:hypothetical protein C8R46DRAFT_431348 [Mycena filopes]|nr:hypothetical protein C8R46DRAFT_431348 [Mycena filopes]